MIHERLRGHASSSETRKTSHLLHWKGQPPHLLNWNWQRSWLLYWDLQTQRRHFLHCEWQTQEPHLLNWETYREATPHSLRLTKRAVTNLTIMFWKNRMYGSKVSALKEEFPFLCQQNKISLHSSDQTVMRFPPPHSLTWLKDCKERGMNCQNNK